MVTLEKAQDNLIRIAESLIDDMLSLGTRGSTYVIPALMSNDSVEHLKKVYESAGWTVKVSGSNDTRVLMFRADKV